MNISSRIYATLIIAALSLVACSSQNPQQANSPDEQRSHARQAQDELSSETSK